MFVGLKSNLFPKRRNKPNPRGKEEKKKAFPLLFPSASTFFFAPFVRDYGQALPGIPDRRKKIKYVDFSLHEGPGTVIDINWLAG